MFHSNNTFFIVLFQIQKKQRKVSWAVSKVTPKTGVFFTNN